MSMKEHSRFDALVAEHLKIPIPEIRDDMTPKDVPAWDSFAFMLFIAEVEKAYGVSFTMDEMLEATCLGDIRKALVRHMKA